MVQTTVSKKWFTEKGFVLSDGTLSRSPVGEVLGMRIRFTGGEVTDLTAADFNNAVRQSAFWAGINARISDAATSGGKDTPAEDRVQAVLDLLDVIKGPNGTWLEEGRQAGPRVGDVAEAYVRLDPQRFVSVEAAKAYLIELASSDPEGYAKRIALPIVQATVAQIRLERAQAKAAQSSVDLSAL